jgi:hypothetical protein
MARYAARVSENIDGPGSIKLRRQAWRLGEWIALDRGYFQDVGIEPSVRWDTPRSGAFGFDMREQ